MPKKEELIDKLCKKPAPSNFSVRELDQLMAKCDCKKRDGGRGSSIAYYHERENRVLTFDAPHSGHELYRYQIKMVIKFLKDIEEIKE